MGSRWKLVEVVGVSGVEPQS